MSQDPVREQIAEILATNAQQFLVVINGRDKFDTDRAATIVLEHLGYGTHRCPRCGLGQAPAKDDTCPPCDLEIYREGIQHQREQLDARDAQIAELKTWPGLMGTLAEHYPPDIIDGSSGDPGPQIITLAREVDRLKAVLERAKALREAVAEDAENDFDTMRAERDEAEERAETAEAELTEVSDTLDDCGIEQHESIAWRVQDLARILGETEDERDSAREDAEQAEAERDRLRTMLAPVMDLMDQEPDRPDLGALLLGELREASNRYHHEARYHRNVEAERDRLATLVDEALAIRMHGQRLWTGGQTWADWDQRAEAERRGAKGLLGDGEAETTLESLGERDRLRETEKRVRALRNQLASGPTVGLIRSLVVSELDAALGQGEQEET